MSAAEALRLAQDNGVRFDISGADLILDAEREPAPAVLEAVKCHKMAIIALLTAHHDDSNAGDWIAFFDRRVDIAVFDHGRSRGEAEALAFECCVVEWLNRHPIRSETGRCLACGKPDREGHTESGGAKLDHGSGGIVLVRAA